MVSINLSMLRTILLNENGMTCALCSSCHQGWHQSRVENLACVFMSKARLKLKVEPSLKARHVSWARLGSAQVQARDRAERSWALEPQQLSLFFGVLLGFPRSNNSDLYIYKRQSCQATSQFFKKIGQLNLARAHRA